MFRVILDVPIWAPNGEFDVCRSLELPFVPHKGMSLGGVLHEGGDLQVKSVRFALGRGFFYVAVHPVMWPDTLTVDDVTSFLVRGCFVDGRSTLKEWLDLGRLCSTRLAGREAQS